MLLERAAEVVLGLSPVFFINLDRQVRRIGTPTGVRSDKSDDGFGDLVHGSLNHTTPSLSMETFGKSATAAATMSSLHATVSSFTVRYIATAASIDIATNDGDELPDVSTRNISLRVLTTSPLA